MAYFWSGFSACGCRPQVMRSSLSFLLFLLRWRPRGIGVCPRGFVRSGVLRFLALKSPCGAGVCPRGFP